MKQVVLIHGADAFDSYDAYIASLRNWEIDFEEFRTPGKGWKRSLQNDLGEAFEVIAPSMPNKQNARYLEWEIWFDKFVPHLNNEVILVGHSMGGIFLTKYLALHTLSQKILGLFLVAAPFESNEKESIADFSLPEDLHAVEKQALRIELFHSQDDPVVPFGDVEKYQAVFPEASVHVFEDRGHFNQEPFPELVEEIKSL